MNKKILLSLLLVFSSTGLMATEATDAMFSSYKQAGASTFDAAAGKALWNKQFKNKKSGKLQNCATCHSANLKAAGKHARTGKRIDPMAPSVNSKRFTDIKKIKKWFKRNCKWTIGRECSAQEQADILSYLITE